MGVQFHALTEGSFFSALSNRWVEADQIQRESTQARYVIGYLQKPQVGAKCFVVEEPYIDGDYLEDFVSFYVSSFPPYDRYCRRLHFFDRDFTAEAVEDVLSGDADPAILQASYVGFIVVRPLPQAVIGRTVLRTYRDDGGGREFPTLRSYQPHLNGIPLPIRSLAFEQQDTSVAACATVALWSAFHKTHELFGSQRARPAAITRAANAVRTWGRALPSNGLSPAQIGEAVRAVGLEPEFFRLAPDTPLASLMYAYVSAGIPVIAGVYVEDHDYHAVTVVGYSRTQGPAAAAEPAYRNVRSKPGLHLDKFYVHDDGVGPFAVAPITKRDPDFRLPGLTIRSPVLLQSDWPLENPSSERSRAYFVPEWIVVPAYPKIRVPYFAVHQWIQRLMRMFTTLETPFAGRGVDVALISWDIRLTMVNDFKIGIRRDYQSNAEARALCQDALPRFLWIATMYQGDVASRLLVFDATDTERTCPLLRAVWLDEAGRELIDAAFADPEFQASWRVPLTPQFYDTLRTGRAAFV